VGKSVIIRTFFRKLIASVLFEQHDKSSPFNSRHYVVLYPQNGDRIVTIASVTSLHRRGVVVSGVRRMNEVNARRAWLVPGWVTVFRRVYHLGM